MQEPRQRGARRSLAHLSLPLSASEGGLLDAMRQVNSVTQVRVVVVYDFATTEARPGRMHKLTESSRRCLRQSWRTRGPCILCGDFNLDGRPAPRRKRAG